MLPHDGKRKNCRVAATFSCSKSDGGFENIKFQAAVFFWKNRIRGVYLSRPFLKTRRYPGGIVMSFFIPIQPDIIDESYSHLHWSTEKEVNSVVDILTTIFISIIAGVICHLICKWLDGNE